MTTYPRPPHPLLHHRVERRLPTAGGWQGQAAIAVTTKFLWLSWFFVFLKPSLSSTATN